MEYLKDTCVFIYKMNNAQEILDVARHCKSIDSKLCTTSTVMRELRPGARVAEDDAERSRDIIKYLEFGQNSKILDIIDLDNNETYNKNLSDIRRRYYDHLTDPDALMELVSSGDYTREEVRSRWFRNKDMGECSCIAIAMEKPEDFTIVTDDKGRVFLKPDTNLFKIYGQSHNIKVLNYEQWIEETEYKLSLSELAIEKSDSE
ncbi:Uncharacterised protein [[Clostridium] sordellii]|uniref:hypothetical protein n=1 Tax=Paraclostridium sordellii TaxID=1505 RepID=UPI0005E4FE9A|nr:hypothetical protein [Paeniclostridium sordellii]CEP97585.1 Uncharacterised protein [[Clostridium] sordellii] [Paeniclostridium sordellii]